MPVGAYQRPRVLTIVRAGGTRRPREKVRIFVNRQTFRTYDQFARDIADAFVDKRRSSTSSQTDWSNSGAVRQGVGIRLFSIGGREVVGVSDLFKDDDLFVGVPAGAGEPTTAEIRDVVEELYPGSPYVEVLLRKWTKARRRSNRMYGQAFAAQQVTTAAAASEDSEQLRSAGEGDRLPEEKAADLTASDTLEKTDDNRSPKHRVDFENAERQEAAGSTTGRDDSTPELRGGEVARGAKYPASKLPRSRRSRKPSRVSDASSVTAQVETASDARLESIREDVGPTGYETSRQHLQGASQNRNQFPAAEDSGYMAPRLNGRNPHILLARRRFPSNQHRLPPIHASSQQHDTISDDNTSAPSSDRRVRLEYRKRQSGNENLSTGDLPPGVPHSSFVSDETTTEPSKPISSRSRKSLEDVSNKKLSSGEEMEPVKKTKRNKDDKTKKEKPEVDAVRQSADQVDGMNEIGKDENGNHLKAVNDDDSSQTASGKNLKPEPETSQQSSGGNVSTLPPIVPPSKAGGQRRASRDSLGHSAMPVFRTKLERQVSRIERVMELYDLGKVLGDGNFAVVRQCRHKTNGREYAMKVVDKSKMRGKEAMIENEIAITKACQHPNIVRLYEEYETKTEIYLVMELVKVGKLFIVTFRLLGDY
jgi:hypothetical protein